MAWKPDEYTRRVVAAHRCIAIFREWLTPGQWAKCEAGKDDPDSFCDSNMAVDEAVRHVFGAPRSCTSPANLARMNAVVRFASRLMVGEAVSDADALAEVRRDDRYGLGLVGGGRRLRAVVAEFVGSPK